MVALVESRLTLCRQLEAFRQKEKEHIPMKMGATALASIVSNPKNAESFRTVETVQLLVHTLLRDWSPETEGLVSTLLLLLGICVRPKGIKKKTERCVLLKLTLSSPFSQARSDAFIPLLDITFEFSRSFEHSTFLVALERT